MQQGTKNLYNERAYSDIKVNIWRTLHTSELSTVIKYGGLVASSLLSDLCLKQVC